MSEEEKAKELVGKFFVHTCYIPQYDIAKDKAKQCALICVSEIILALYHSEEKFDWQKVELEIDKL